MPACRDASRIDVSDVEAAFAHVDVQAALAAKTSPVYGDRLIPDAPSVGVSRASGGAFGVGSDCPTASASCVLTPPTTNPIYRFAAAWPTAASCS
jgi:hypothetical protein